MLGCVPSAVHVNMGIVHFFAAPSSSNSESSANNQLCSTVRTTESVFPSSSRTFTCGKPICSVHLAITAFVDWHPANFFPSSPQIDRLRIPAFVLFHVVEGIHTRDSLDHSHDTSSITVANRVKYLLDFFRVMDPYMNWVRTLESVRAHGREDRCPVVNWSHMAYSGTSLSAAQLSAQLAKPSFSHKVVQASGLLVAPNQHELDLALWLAHAFEKVEVLFSWNFKSQ
jgi:hypothetical protein